jgi:hypothetical protein
MRLIFSKISNMANFIKLLLKTKILFILTSTSANADQVNVHLMKETKPAIENKDFSTIPRSHPQINRSARDQLFSSTGLSNYLGNFDEVDKNVLYLRIRELALDKVVALYPKIPKAHLEETQTLLNKARK